MLRKLMGNGVSQHTIPTGACERVRSCVGLDIQDKILKGLIVIRIHVM